MAEARANPHSVPHRGDQGIENLAYTKRSDVSTRDADEILREIHQSVSEARLAFRFWRTFTDPKSGHRYEPIFRVYPLFAAATTWAFFMACGITLYRLYESRDDTVNFDQLIRLLEHEGRVSKPTIVEARASLRGPAWVKIAVLRNEALAHAKFPATVDSTYAKARLSPGEIEEVVEQTASLLNRLAAASGRPSFVFDATESDDLTRLLEAQLSFLRADQATSSDSSASA